MIDDDYLAHRTPSGRDSAVRQLAAQGAAGMSGGAARRARAAVIGPELGSAAWPLQRMLGMARRFL
jgi:hypothetical protein